MKSKTNKPDRTNKTDKLEEEIKEEIKEIKQQLDEVQKLLKNIYDHLMPSQTIPPAKIYSLKEKARKKALEIKKKLDVE